MGRPAGTEVPAAGAAGLGADRRTDGYGRGVAADYGMLVAAVITTGLIIWRDRATGPAWQTVAAGLLFALLIAWSGHDTVQIGAAVVLVAMTLAQPSPAAHGRLMPVRSRRPSRAS